MRLLAADEIAVVAGGAGRTKQGENPINQGLYATFSNLDGIYASIYGQYNNGYMTLDGEAPASQSSGGNISACVAISNGFVCSTRDSSGHASGAS